MKFQVLTGPQGGGKSTVMRREAISTAGLYLFALPTTELIDEQFADFFGEMPQLETVKIYAQPNLGTTAKRLTAARKDIEGRKVKHAVIFTTHATMMDHALDGFDDWHARIDEAPAAVQAGRFNIEVATRAFLANSFDLVGMPGVAWSALKLKASIPNFKAIERDAGSKPFGEFLKQAKQPDRVFVKATDWANAKNIDWFAMWTPLSLAHFASVQVAGSSYTQSVGFQVAHGFFPDLLGVGIRAIAPARTGQPAITIHYFTRGHVGTTTFWGGIEGRRMIRPICDYLDQVLPENGFWSGNEVVTTQMDARLKPKLIKPLAIGLNKHRGATDCAFIYSAKAKRTSRVQSSGERVKSSSSP